MLRKLTQTCIDNPFLPYLNPGKLPEPAPGAIGLGKPLQEKKQPIADRV